MKKASEYVLILLGVLIALLIVFSVAIEINNGGTGHLSQSEAESAPLLPAFSGR
jgi:hypothetical protein